MTCVVCGESLVNKYPQARYCSSNCKYKANRNLESIAAYTDSIKGRAKTLWHNSRARTTNHTITEDWIASVLNLGVCQVTGIPFEWSSGKGRQPFSPSLDQICPGKGYTPENTRIVIWMYNAAKNVFTDADVLKMAYALVKINAE